jgi:hypothetical protein
MARNGQWSCVLPLSYIRRTLPSGQESSELSCSCHTCTCRIHTCQLISEIPIVLLVGVISIPIMVFLQEIRLYSGEGNMITINPRHPINNCRVCCDCPNEYTCRDEICSTHTTSYLLGRVEPHFPVPATIVNSYLATAYLWICGHCPEYPATCLVCIDYFMDEMYKSQEHPDTCRCEVCRYWGRS